METINLKEKFSRFSDYTNPRVIVLIEPKSTLNTGNIINERTVAQPERI